MTDQPDAQLEEVRDALFGVERAALADLREKAEEVAVLRERVEALEALVLDRSDRTQSVSEVIVDAVASRSDGIGDLGGVLKPEIEAAVRESARDDSSVLAEALYPVMGPALRKMIAALFTSGDDKSGEPFRVEQVMLMERHSGVLLACTASDASAAAEADVVSGMLDAVRHFVQDAFEVDDHDGLRDLRVGDLSVLVEWGPSAVLASVVRGVATDAYRRRAAVALEEIHFEMGEALEAFDGLVAPFNAAGPALAALHESGLDTRGTSGSVWRRSALVMLVALAVLALVVWLW